MNDFIDIDGLPSFNFQKLPKNFRNIKINQPRKSTEETFSIEYKDKYINEYLLNFSKKEKNSHLNELVNNIIDFRKKCLNMDKKDNKIRKIIASNYLLFHNLEKNLIEFSYISKKENRDEKIENLYEWYKDIINKNKTLKAINARYDNNLFEEKNSDINEINKDNKEDDLKNKENNKENISTEIINKKLSESFNQKESNLNQSSSSIKLKKNLSWNFMTKISLKKEYTKFNNFPIINSEIFKPSYKKNQFPKIKNRFFRIEKDIMENKLKMLREKGSIEGIIKVINKFGITRAKFKENLNTKYETKELIKMYINEHNNDFDINNSKLLKKYLNKKINIKNINKNNFRTFTSKNNINWNKTTDKNKETEDISNLKLNIGNIFPKQQRIFYGINHTKIFIDKIKNINEFTRKINDNVNNIKTFNIKMKICGNDIKISNLLSKSTEYKNSIIKEGSNHIISNHVSFEEDIKNQNMPNDTNEIKKKHINYSLSLFSEINSKKIKLYRERNKRTNLLGNKPLNLNEEKKLYLFNNYIHNKNNFLSVRKNMEILNKYDYKQIESKNSNYFSNHSIRYDNIHEDDITDNYIDKEINKKNENKLQKRIFLSKALFEPKCTTNFFSLYYFPRPESNLLKSK